MDGWAKSNTYRRKGNRGKKIEAERRLNIKARKKESRQQEIEKIRTYKKREIKREQDQWELQYEYACHSIFIVWKLGWKTALTEN